VGQQEIKTVPDAVGVVFSILGMISQILIGREIKIPQRWNYALAIAVGVIWYILQPKRFPRIWGHGHWADFRDWSDSVITIWWLSLVVAVPLMFALKRTKPTDPSRRHFLRASTAAVCAAVPTAVLATGVITRKDFHVTEIDIKFPNLPKDLAGLRLLQLSDVHMGTFYSAEDLRRVVDASNHLQADLAFITGDLITTKADPVDRCLAELSRLRSASGIWGCMGNHELYTKLEDYTKRRAREFGIDFLRQEARLLKFGSAQLNLVGVDFRPWQQLQETEGLLALDSFNLLLAHTPEIFPQAAEKGFDLTLSGHTHGGQINIDLFGTNLNVADVHTPYTKGLYRLPTSVIYVNSGLGTIGLPVRLGAPPEITLIRLCST
jgi:uncharacterized protein